MAHFFTHGLIYDEHKHVASTWASRKYFTAVTVTRVKKHITGTYFHDTLVKLELL